MNRNHLIESFLNISQQKGKKEMSKKYATECVDIFFQSISEVLKKEGKLSIVGFGTWNVTHREAKKGRNPKNGQEMMIPASNVLRFKTGKNLKDSLNNK